MNDSTPKLEQLGASIRLIRFFLGYSVEELAHYAGIDRKFLSDIEHGYINAGLLTYEKICVALEINMSDLFATTED